MDSLLVKNIRLYGHHGVSAEERLVGAQYEIDVEVFWEQGTLNVTDEMLVKMIEINIKSALRLVRLIVPKMIERNSCGSIINIASIAGLRPQPGGLLYSFTKAGLIMMTRAWAQEFGPYGIRVNTIAPGLIQTDFSQYFWRNETLRQRVEATQPIRRIGQPNDIGYAALYLASEESSYMTGQVIVIDGGETLGWYE